MTHTHTHAHVPVPLRESHEPNLSQSNTLLVPLSRMPARSVYPRSVTCITHTTQPRRPPCCSTTSCPRAWACSLSASLSRLLSAHCSRAPSWPAIALVLLCYVIVSPNSFLFPVAHLFQFPCLLCYCVALPLLSLFQHRSMFVCVVIAFTRLFVYLYSFMLCLYARDGMLMRVAIRLCDTCRSPFSPHLPCSQRMCPCWDLLLWSVRHLWLLLDGFSPSVTSSVSVRLSLPSDFKNILVQKCFCCMTLVWVVCCSCCCPVLFILIAAHVLALNLQC